MSNIRKIKMLLGGNVNLVRRVLEKEMREYSDKEMFEEAKEISFQVRALANAASIQDTDAYLENPNFLEDVRQKELDDLGRILNLKRKLSRIECFDIAHFAGKGTTASMVTFIEGEAEKKYYRHFKIYQNMGNSDVDSMKEVLRRRLKHLEDWGKPDLIIVDGGKPQVSAASEVLEGSGIPFIGLAKRFETIVIKNENGFVEVRATGESLKLLQRIRDEAHRFARRLHHKQLKDSMKIGKI